MRRQTLSRKALLRLSAFAAVLVVAACASPDLPQAYRSEAVPGAIDCTTYPRPPAPPSCRNLYEDITHGFPAPPIGPAGLR